MWWKSRKQPGQTAPAAAAEEADLRASGQAPLSAVAKKVKELEIIARRPSAARLSGQYKSRFRGTGMQFSDSRLYQYGDDTRHIDWRTSARSEETFVKTFDEERELNIICAVDMSASNLFGSGGGSKLDTMALAVANIAFAALANNDRVGLLLFTDHIERFVPPRKGKKHVLRVLDELLGHKPVGRGTNHNEAMKFLANVVNNHSIVFFASDFLAPLDKKRLLLLAKKFDFIALHTRDTRETALPKVGIVEFEDPETGQTIAIDCSSDWAQNEFTRQLRERRRDSLDGLKRAGTELLPLAAGEDPSGRLLRFFHQRRRGRK